jgi:hypothetical protein
MIPLRLGRTQGAIPTGIGQPEEGGTIPMAKETSIFGQTERAVLLENHLAFRAATSKGSGQPKQSSVACI